MDKQDKEFDPADVLGGTLDIFGFKLDLGELFGSSNLKDRLEELRETLKRAGGKEALSDDEWRQGGVSVTGRIRTSGPLGEQEYHVGTMGKPGRQTTGRPTPEPPEMVEPPVDVFDEGQQVTIVADVPGVSLEDLELKIEGNTFTLKTKATARRNYRKELHIQSDLEPDSLKATCRNGALEVRLHKR